MQMETTLVEDDALRILRQWAESGAVVGVLYAGADGRCLIALRGRLRDVSAGQLYLAGESSFLSVAIDGSAYRLGPLSSLPHDAVTGSGAEGLHILTTQGRWLFLSPSYAPAEEDTQGRLPR